MDRPKRWGLVLSGLTLVSMSGGCRGTHSKIPPEPRLAPGGSTQAQFSSDPPPAVGPIGLNGPSGPASVSPGLNGMAMPGQAPGGTHNDVPYGGLGTPSTPPQSQLMPPQLQTMPATSTDGSSSIQPPSPILGAGPNNQAAGTMGARDALPGVQ